MDDPRRNLRMINPSSNIISFSDYQHHQSVEMLDHDQESSWDSHLNSLMCSLSLLKEKVNQVHSIATSSSSSSSSSSSPSSLPGMTTLIQEIIVTASNMMFNCQQMALVSPPAAAPTGNNNTLPVIYEYDHLQDGSHFHGCNNKLYNSDTSGKKSINDDDQCNVNGLHNGESRESDHQGQARPNFIASDHQEPSFYWYNDAYNNSTNNSTNCITNVSNGTTMMMMSEGPENYDIIEIDAAELLAKYTHYCQVCGKGFKRDANLRMHMRAHGDEYKSSAALSNPLKNNKETSSENVSTTSQVARKYSCPQEGCRWNRKHAKFQPLKSMICVKNHYKRTHCPKMYVCNRCNRKQFSVLSDLRTHEKHCGDLRWRCSCGTTFSRKDKLMGHVALFVGHSPVGLPAGSSSSATAK